MAYDKTPADAPERTLRPVNREGRRRLASEWAKVGGPGFRAKTTDAFQAEDYRDRFRRGDAREIYVGACSGLGRVAKTANVPIYKPSTCSSGRIDGRMDELKRDEYGAWRFCDGDYVREDGWDDWFPSHLYPRLLPSPNSPVQMEARSIRVTLPEGMTAEEFDAMFDAEIRKAGVDLWAMTDVARNHCATLGVDPAILIRHTKYPGWRFSPAYELACFSIFSGADRLVSIAEALILGHFGLKP